MLRYRSLVTVALLFSLTLLIRSAGLEGQDQASVQDGSPSQKTPDKTEDAAAEKAGAKEAGESPVDETTTVAAPVAAHTIDFAAKLMLPFPSLKSLGARIEQARDSSDPVALGLLAFELKIAERTSGITSQGIPADVIAQMPENERPPAINSQELLDEAVELGRLNRQYTQLKALARIVDSFATDEKPKTDGSAEAGSTDPAVALLSKGLRGDLEAIEKELQKAGAAAGPGYGQPGVATPPGPWPRPTYDFIASIMVRNRTKNPVKVRIYTPATTRWDTYFVAPGRYVNFMKPTNRSGRDGAGIQFYWWSPKTRRYDQRHTFYSNKHKKRFNTMRISGGSDAELIAFQKGSRRYLKWKWNRRGW